MSGTSRGQPIGCGFFSGGSSRISFPVITSSSRFPGHLLHCRPFPASGRNSCPDPNISPSSLQIATILPLVTSPSFSRNVWPIVSVTIESIASVPLDPFRAPARLHAKKKRASVY